jgi:murein DD-endopeptidase MepM/ murein hydrolase activator NlpD
MMSRFPLYVLLAGLLASTTLPRGEGLHDPGARYSARPRVDPMARPPRSGQAAGGGANAQLDMVRNGQATDVFVDNRLAGPVEAELFFTAASNVQSLPELPLRQVIEARRRVLVSRIEPLVATSPVSSYALGMRTIPGDPRAMPDEMSYSLPVDENSRWELGQVFHGGFSHSDEQNRYAVDFIVDVGTPVLAARGGTVMEVMSGFSGSGLNRKEFVDRANFIRVLHDDGSMAVYAHLQENGVLVDVGDRVSLGQQIAFSGNTGYSSGPHLHFCLQVNRGMRLVSVPFRMVGPQGFVPLPSR